MPKQDKRAKKMRGHDSRNKDGTLRKIRDDTQMGTLEKRYGVEFEGRKDIQWGTYRKRHGLGSISEAVEKVREKK